MQCFHQLGELCILELQYMLLNLLYSTLYLQTWYTTSIKQKDITQQVQSGIKSFRFFNRKKKKNVKALWDSMNTVLYTNTVHVQCTLCRHAVTNFVYSTAYKNFLCKFAINCGQQHIIYRTGHCNLPSCFANSHIYFNAMHVILTIDLQYQQNLPHMDFLSLGTSWNASTTDNARCSRPNYWIRLRYYLHH